MKKQVFNPYLPSWEYIPDGEPYVFNDRVYVYGSHDSFGAPIFCVKDYVCWSAPVNDLTDWKYEGVIYKKNQDPSNKLGIHLLFAPDVVKGVDGRYYLYYALDFLGEMGVAVCDTPSGKFEFYGHIRFKDGRVWGKKSGDEFPFDPGVLVDDDGRIYLYSGFATKVPSIASRFNNLKNSGGVVLELEEDMVTIKTEPELLFPIKNTVGAFKNHAFFEASSIRKVDGKYCFVYSSEHNHDLCYAMADYSKGPYTFGGKLVDLGDIGLNQNLDKSKAINYLGNTHGGMLELNGQWYIFYHRHTNRSSYSRQACAEKLERTTDGGFKQAEVTSCGLNNGALLGVGKYEARIACNLRSIEGTGRYDCRNPKKRFKKHPYFTQSGKDREENGDQYIANMRNGAVAGFKYFYMEEPTKMFIEVSGNTSKTSSGKMVVSDKSDFSNIISEIHIQTRGKYMGKNKIFFSEKLKFIEGEKALYFKYVGDGAINFYGFELVK